MVSAALRLFMPTGFVNGKYWLPQNRHAFTNHQQEGLAVASIAQDDPSTLPGDDPIPCARMHRDRNAR